jgi:hypothetical protein
MKKSSRILPAKTFPKNRGVLGPAAVKTVRSTSQLTWRNYWKHSLEGEVVMEKDHSETMEHLLRMLAKFDSNLK